MFKNLLIFITDKKEQLKVYEIYRASLMPELCLHEAHQLTY